jgi:anti-anti-sigma factor
MLHSHPPAQLDQSLTGPPGFALSRVQDADGTITIALSGELDVASAPAVAAALADAQGDTALVVLDLGGLSFIDSTGLRTILVAHGQAERDGRRLVIVHGPPAVRRVFSMTGLDACLEMIDQPGGVDGNGVRR